MRVRLRDDTQVYAQVVENESASADHDQPKPMHMV
jgi:hypothetical protein